MRKEGERVGLNVDNTAVTSLEQMKINMIMKTGNGLFGGCEKKGERRETIQFVCEKNGQDEKQCTIDNLQ